MVIDPTATSGKERGGGGGLRDAPPELYTNQLAYYIAQWTRLALAWARRPENGRREEGAGEGGGGGRGEVRGGEMERERKREG